MWSTPVMFCHPTTGQIVRVHGREDGIEALGQLGLLLPANVRSAAFLALRASHMSAARDAGRASFAAALSSTLKVCPAPAPTANAVVVTPSNISRIDNYLPKTVALRAPPQAQRLDLQEPCERAAS